jgi:hypothetical protein
MGLSAFMKWLEMRVVGIGLVQALETNSQTTFELILNYLAHNSEIQLNTGCLLF